MSEFRVDLNSQSTPFTHFWEECVGSDHARMALRADWQEQLKQAKRDLGFKRVRFHGLLDDDMGTCLIERNRKIYSFFNIDQIFDFLSSIDMTPFVELSFMPKALASGPETVFSYEGNITPPRRMSEWCELIEKLAAHWQCRYGEKNLSEWLVEVWNEPNLKAFWTGSKEEYFEFYRQTARVIKTQAPSLRVGGPVTADNEWIDDFVKNCSPIDFVSTHHYPTDAFGKPTDDTIEQLRLSHRGVLREEALRVREQAGARPVYYTEWASSSNPFDELHDQPYAAAFAAKTVVEMDGLLHGYSYWTFTDIFEENYFAGVPFHGGFGLLTVHGIAKPAYRAFEMLHRLGEERLPVNGAHPTVDVYAFRKERESQILLVNSNLAGHPIASENVTVELNGRALKRATLERIDSHSANPRKLWEAMGSPDSLHTEQVQELKRASETFCGDLRLEGRETDLHFTLEMEPQSVALVRLIHE